MTRSVLGALILALAAFGCGGGTPVQQDASTTGNKLVGEPCTKNGDCKSVQCLTDEVAFTLLQHTVMTYGGYCILFPCDPAKNDTDCGEGAHCFNGEPYGADMWICLKTCDTTHTCERQDYECFEDLANIPDGGGTARWGCIPNGLIQFDGGVQDDAAVQTD